MRVYALFCVLFLFSRLLENRVLKFNLLFRDTSNFVVQIGQIELATGMSNNDVYIALGGDVTICDTSKHNGKIEHYLHYNVNRHNRQYKQYFSWSTHLGGSASLSYVNCQTDRHVFESDPLTVMFEIHL